MLLINLLASVQISFKMVWPKIDPSEVIGEKKAKRLVQKATKLFPQDMDNFFPPRVAESIEICAKHIRTQPTAVCASLLATTAAIIAGKVGFTISSDIDYVIVPSLFLVMIGRDGWGKSPAVKRYCRGILRKIENIFNVSLLENPGSSATVREFFHKTNGYGMIYTDEIYSWLHQFTTKPDGAQIIGFLNDGWSGGEIRIAYKTARSLHLPDTCVSIHGGLHPKSAAMLMKLWNNGDGFKNRVLFAAMTKQTMSTRDWLEFKRTGPESEFDIDSTLSRLYNYFVQEPELFILTPDDRALELIFQFDEEIMAKTELDEEDVNEENDESRERGYGKLEDLMIHVAQVMHCLVHALLSFKDTGEINIPSKIEHTTIQSAIEYVRSSEGIASVFDETDSITDESRFILLNGLFLTPRLVSEAFSRRNLPGFTDPKTFIAVSKKLQGLGLGKLVDITVDLGNGRKRKHLVFFKCPPKEVLTGTLKQLGITVHEYRSGYLRQHRLSRTVQERLSTIICEIAKQNPYNRKLKKSPRMFSPVIDEVDSQHENSFMIENDEESLEQDFEELSAMFCYDDEEAGTQADEIMDDISVSQNSTFNSANEVFVPFIDIEEIF